MATVHMSEAELARDLHAVLEQVRQGVEVVIEEDDRPIAVLRPTGAGRPGRKIAEVVAELRARGGKATMDEDFARDVELGIRSQNVWNPPSWE